MFDHLYQMLREPFPEEKIHWRIGARTSDKTKGIPLAYIDARDVMDRLDEVIGPGNWSDTYHETPSGRVICELTIGYITKSDGAGDTGTEGEKGAISDAFKRAAVKWGIGRYLYSLPNQWVPLIKDGRAFEKPPKLPESHKPRNRRVDREKLQVYLQSFLEALSKDDGMGLKELSDELETFEVEWLWRLFSVDQKNRMKALIHELKEE